MRTILCLVLLLCADAASALGYNGARGLWYDRAHAGHGIDVELIGGTAFVVLYTFDANGEPEWYTAQGALANNALDADLLRFRYDAAAHSQALDGLAGRLVLRYDAVAGAGNCADGVDRANAGELAQLSIDIGAEHVRWCVEPLIPAQTQPATAMSGLWWGGAGDSGWGLATYFVPAPNATLSSTHLLYFYDAAGRARWAIGQTSDADFSLALPLVSYRGFCRTCAAAPLAARDGGTMSLALSSPRGDAGAANTIALAARYPGGGEWNRDGTLARLSDTIAPPLVAVTREGIVSPDIFLDDGATVRWLGIPYAAPPVGDLRFAATRAAAPRRTVLDATRVAPGCPQNASESLYGAAPATQSEDCLTLSVWAPRLPDAPKLPVMVWIHGGGFVQGSSLQDLPVGSGAFTYDGSNLTHRQVVYVAMNYRLGALGFLAHRDVAGASGNYGMLDQQAALRWVRDNIGAFGGDPSNVTIFGESAGGVSVCAHLAAPGSRGLFSRAIMESGNCLKNVARLDTPVGTIEPAYAQGDRVAGRLGCTTNVAACLRAQSVDAIVAAAQGTSGFGRSGEQYGPKNDGVFLTESPGAAIANGDAAAVPFVIGVNADEATSLVPTTLRPQTPAAYEAMVRTTFPTIADAVLARYPASAYTPVWRAYTAIVTDVSFICPARRAARDHTARGNAAYAYYFTQTNPLMPELGAFHGFEIPFLFSVITPQGIGAAALADSMRDTWTGFAYTGIPGSSGIGAWPRHATTGAIGVELNGAGIRVDSDYRADYCDFWARYVAL